MLTAMGASNAASALVLLSEQPSSGEKYEEYINNIRNWILTDAKFFGRTDDEFVLKFLYGCKFDLERTKRKMTMYYETRRKVSKWWAKRDLNDERMLSIAKLKITTVLKGKDLKQPGIVISRTSHIGPNLSNFDVYAAMHSLILEMALIRENCQLNGIIWIIDFEKFPTWLFIRLLSPLVAKDCITSFYLSMPVRIQDVHVINANFISYTLWRLIHTFLTQKMRKRVHFYGSDWSRLKDSVPIELLPEEYGGHAGPMHLHEDSFLKEVLDHKDYFLSDNQYGFQPTDENETDS
ncbi:hypothetical protein CHUAL_012087 [Chamberlinius hualienensis]